MPKISDSSLVVHLHFHHRTSGITSHVESVVRALLRLRPVSILSLGATFPPDLPRISLFLLLKRLASQQTTLFHSHRQSELMLALLLKAAGRLLGAHVKVVHTRHSVGAGGVWTRFLCRLSDQMIVLTPEAQPMLKRSSRVIGHGVDLERFYPNPDSNAPSGLSQEYAHYPYGIGVVGRIRPRKGQMDFAQALARLQLQTDDWMTCLHGLITVRNRRFARQLKAQWPHLIHLDRSVHSLKVYQSLTIVVQPSHEESYSLALLEAMACGCCVIAAELPHYHRFIQQGVTGFLYPVGDIGALADLMTLLMRDPERARQTGLRARHFVQSHFSIQQEAQALHACYQQMISWKQETGVS